SSMARTCARCASLSKIPGRRLLMVTLWAAVCRASPAAKPTSPERAPFDRPSSNCAIFTLRETMLMMRPNPRVIMPSTVSRIISIGESIIASSAAIQSSRDQSRKSPGAGPSALLRRISGCGQAASAAERPAPVVMSAATVVTLTPVAAAISALVFSSTSRLRATMVTSTPSRASAKAQARPKPRLAPLSSAFRPRIPRSMSCFSYGWIRMTWQIRMPRASPLPACGRRSAARSLDQPSGRRYSRCDGGDGTDLVAVLLVEPELLHDANAFGERLAVEVGQRLAQVAGRQRERLHQRFHRHRIDRRIGEVQQRQEFEVGGLEIFPLGVARPWRRDGRELGRRDIAGHVGGAVAAERHGGHHEPEIGAVAAHDRDLGLGGQYLRDLPDAGGRFLVHHVVRMLEDAKE